MNQDNLDTHVSDDKQNIGMSTEWGNIIQQLKSAMKEWCYNMDEP